MERVRKDKKKKEIKGKGMRQKEEEKEKEKEEYEMNILVRCVNGVGERMLREMEFHMVDLDKKELCLRHFPSIYTRLGSGDMLMLHANMLILGGLFGQSAQKKAHDINDDKEDDTILIHKGSSQYSLLFNKWDIGYLPLNSAISNPARVSTSICCFGFPWLRPEISIWGIWHKLGLPPHLQGRQVSLPVVPDPANSRFLVHLHDCYDLYAFHPPTQHHQDGQDGQDGEWKLLSHFSTVWSKAIAVLDGVLFLHEYDYPNLLAAYDLTSNTWLNVVSDLHKVTIRLCIFQSMFTLPSKGLICLANRYFPINKTPPSVHFLRLKVQRMDPSTIKLTALDYQSHPIPSSSEDCDFLML